MRHRQRASTPGSQLPAPRGGQREVCRVGLGQHQPRRDGPRRAGQGGGALGVAAYRAGACRDVVTAVPLAGVPASLVVGPPPELLLPPPQPTTSAPAAASRVSATSVRRRKRTSLGCNLNSGTAVRLHRGSWFPGPPGLHDANTSLDMPAGNGRRCWGPSWAVLIAVLGSSLNDQGSQFRCRPGPGRTPPARAGPAREAFGPA
jgi:hypothetical protein